MTPLAPSPRALEAFFGVTLWLAAFGHFTLLLASFQVPSRLGWREELRRLSPFNRKLMWTYGGFTVLTIVGFGILSLVLHEELLRGERAALWLAGFIGAFWTTRLVVDVAYFGHAGWPPGRRFVVGHLLLEWLFIFLAGTYLGLVAFHVWFR